MPILLGHPVVSKLSSKSFFFLDFSLKNHNRKYQEVFFIRLGHYSATGFVDRG